MLDYPDLINFAFELGAGFVLCLNVKAILKDKVVKGVSVTTYFFYTFWGFWNIFYYYQLSQKLSWYGGIFVVSVNFVYTCLLVYYKFWLPRQKNKPDGLPTP